MPAAATPVRVVRWMDAHVRCDPGRSESLAVRASHPLEEFMIHVCNNPFIRARGPRASTADRVIKGHRQSGPRTGRARDVVDQCGGNRQQDQNRDGPRSPITYPLPGEHRRQFVPGGGFLLSG